MRQHDYTTKMANSIIDDNIFFPMEYRKHIPVWIKSFANKIGRIPQGVDSRVEGTDTMCFCPTTVYPKAEGNTWHTGELLWIIFPKIWPIFYLTPSLWQPDQIPRGGRTRTSDLTTEQLLFNSSISSTEARLISCDTNNAFLCIPMECYEYICLPLNIIPEKIL